MTAFAALFELRDHAGNDGLLRIDKTLKVMGVVSTSWHDRKG